LRRKRVFRFVILFACCLVVFTGFLVSRAIFEAERLHAALTKINQTVAQSGVESLTRTDLESIIGRPPEFVLAPATDSADGLTELYWARIAAQSQDEAILDTVELELRRNNAESVEKVPGAVLENIVLHAYVRRDGTVFSVSGDEAARSLSQFVLEKIDCWIGALTRKSPPQVSFSSGASAVTLQEVSPDGTPKGDSSTIDRTKHFNVGNVIISGNDRTPDNVILRLFGAGGGSSISGEELQAVAGRLADSGLFVVDPPGGIRPRVQVLDLDSDQHFKDVLITIAERK
jgi:hypothetical protein